MRLISVFAAICNYLLKIKLFYVYFSNPMAILASLTIAVSPLTFEFAGEIMAEELFSVGLNLMLILTIHCAKFGGGGRHALIMAVMVGLAAGSALLLRTIGIAIIAGMLLGLAINRRWKSCLIAGVAAGIVIQGDCVFKSFA